MKNKGFTLIEFLIVIAVMAILIVAGFSLYRIWQNKSSVNNGEIILISALREAKLMATLGNNDSNWGVKYLTGSVVVFSGSNYLSRDVSQDKFFYLPAGVSISGLDEFIFSKFTGLPLTTLNSIVSYGTENIQINVSSQGVFSR